MRKVLILIDDDKVANFINRKIIERTFPEPDIHQFLSAWEAIDYLYKVDPSEELKIVILLDINMPGMNGWDFLKELQKEFDHSFITVHILSSSVDPEDKIMASGFSVVKSFITKPLSKEKIQNQISY